MKIIKIEQGSDEWKAFREGKITGTKIGKLWSKSRKAEELYDTTKPNLQLYQVMAERLAIATADGIDGVSAMERGSLLENEAVQATTEKLGLDNWIADNVWQDETDDSFLCSPDAYENNDRPKWAIEVKCLSSANHIKAIYENRPPDEYWPQVVNYFLINDDLETLYFVMYDPRFFNEELQLKIFTIHREQLESDIALTKVARSIAQEQINEFVEKYSF